MVLNAKFSNKKSFLAFYTFKFKKLRALFTSESYFLNNVQILWPGPIFWLAKNIFGRIEGWGMCVLCVTTGPNVFIEDWSRIWISLKVTKSKIFFFSSNHHKLNPNFCVIVLQWWDNKKIWFQINLPLHRWFHEIFLYRFVKNHENISFCKVEKILKGSLDLIPSPSPSVKFKLWTGKFAWGVKAKHCWAFHLFSKVCWHHPAMFCLITSSKLSRP